MTSRGEESANQVGSAANRDAAHPRRDKGLRARVDWRNACFVQERMNRLVARLRLGSRLRIALAATALACGLATACFTPSVPLPPPIVEGMQFSAASTPGQVILTSKPQTQIGAARFSIFNESQGIGVIIVSNNDGSFTTPPFPGNDGDYIQVRYERGTDLAERCTTLHVGTMLNGAACH